MTENTAVPPPRNIGLWVGFGVLGAMVLSCCLMTFWAQSYGLRFILRQDDESKMWISRMLVVGALEGTRKSCTDGVISEDTLPWFHANLPSESRNRACLLQETMLQALSTPERSATVSLEQTDRAELATKLGLDPTLCFQHSTDRMSVVGCLDAEGGPGSIPYQIIDLNLSSP
jgi:hypothetical protein